MLQVATTTQWSTWATVYRLQAGFEWLTSDRTSLGPFVSIGYYDGTNPIPTGTAWGGAPQYSDGHGTAAIGLRFSARP